jgi:hypothetical protein
LQKFHKPAAEGGVPRGPLLACVDKLGSHIGKLGAECGDDQLVMIDDRLAIRGRFERRVGLDGMCGGHPAGHHAEIALPQIEGGDPTVLGRVTTRTDVGSAMVYARLRSGRYAHVSGSFFS